MPAARAALGAPPTILVVTRAATIAATLAPLEPSRPPRLKERGQLRGQLSGELILKAVMWHSLHNRVEQGLSLSAILTALEGITLRLCTQPQFVECEPTRIRCHNPRRGSVPAGHDLIHSPAWQ